MNTKWGSLIVAAAAATGQVACTQDATLSTDALAPVKVGLITSLSGGLASLGPGWVETARTAEIEIAAAGGPLPGRPLVMIVDDDGTDGARGRAAAQRLVDEEGIVGIVGAAASGVSAAVNEVARANAIPQISCCSTSDLLTPGDDIPMEERFFFRTVSPDGGLQAPVLAENVARNRLMCDALGVIHLDDTYGMPFGLSLEAKFEELGGVVPERVAYTEGEPSYRDQVATLIAGMRMVPDGQKLCVALVSYPADGGIILREFTEMAPDLDVTFIGGDGVKSTGLVESAGDSALVANMLGTAPFTEQGSMSNTRFIEAHRAIWGERPDAGLFPSAQYDAAAILFLAIAYAGQPDGRAIRDAMYAVSNRNGGEEFFTAGELARALAYIRDNPGIDIDFEGASGPCELNSLGYAPTNYEIWRYDEETNAFVTDTIVRATDIQ